MLHLKFGVTIPAPLRGGREGFRYEERVPEIQGGGEFVVFLLPLEIKDFGPPSRGGQNAALYA